MNLLPDKPTPEIATLMISSLIIAALLFLAGLKSEGGAPRVPPIKLFSFMK